MANPIQRLARWFKGADPRQVYANQASIVGIYQPSVLPPVDAQALAETEQENPTIGRAVDVIARDAASVPLQLTRRLNKGKTREIVETHPALDVLKWINAVDTPNVWWQSVYADLLIYGDHFSWVQIDQEGAHNILRLPAQSVRPIPDKVHIIGGYEWEEDGKKQIYPANEIIHIKTRNPDSIYRGLSLLERLRGTILLEREMRRWRLNHFRNNVPSTLIIKTKKLISNEAEMTRLMDHIHRKMSGSENAGKPFVVNADETEIDYLPRPSEEEVAFIKGIEASRTEIATVFGVPPSELMDFSDAFRANAKEQGRAYWEATIMGWHRLTLEWLNTVWLPRFFQADTDLEFVYDYSAVRALGFSAYEMAQVNEILVRSGIRTPNEARHAMGDDEFPSDEANQLYLGGRPLGADPFGGMFPGLGDTANPQAEPDEADPEEHMDDAMRNILPLRPLLKDFNPSDLFDEAEEIRRLRSRVEQVITEMVRIAGEQQLLIDGIDGAFNLNDPAVLDMIRRQSIKVTEETISTTVFNVRRSVAELLASGVPTDDRAVLEAIQSAYAKRKEPWQLKRISRTEAHQAQEGASYHSASQNGIEFKRWLSSRDSEVRTEPEEKRSDHAAMDGQVVPIDAKFEDPKSHARLMYPGDADGATKGHDVINCRCTWISAIPEDDVLVRRFVDHDAAWMKKHTTRGQFERSLVVLFLAHLDDMEARTIEKLEQARRNVA